MLTFSSFFATVWRKNNQHIYSNRTLTTQPMLLRAIRVLPDAVPFFSYARSRDIQSIKSPFQRGLASPIDVSVGDWRSVAYCIVCRQSKVARFLVEQSADCEYEDNYFILLLVWRYLFSARQYFCHLSSGN